MYALSRRSPLLLMTMPRTLLRDRGQERALGGDRDPPGDRDTMS